MALYFVWGFLGGRRGTLWAEVVSLAAYMATIFVFNYTVVVVGAWTHHPVEYTVLNVVAIPLVLLFLAVVRDLQADTR